MSADQFESQWVNVITDLESLGISQNSRSLYLAYHAKIDPATRYDVQKDRRSYPRRDKGGGEEMRGAETWEEAHELCRELENL